MASWSTRRKYGYFFGFVSVAALAAGGVFYGAFYEAPICSDGKMNGTERGVDCGGSCVRLCAADNLAPRVLWSYASAVVPSVYNALAYVENPNVGAEAASVPYVFRFYDSKGLLVAERKGSAFIPAGQRLAVFQGGIDTGNRVVSRTTFEFTAEPQWRGGVAVTKIRALTIDVDASAAPRAEARVKNDSPSQSYENVDATIVLYDADGNRMAFSRTTIERLAPGETATAYFTWPTAFPKEPVRKELLFVVPPKR